VLLSAPIWLPLVALGAVLVMLDGHNPFYSQERLGRNGRVFRIWKLRSMVPDADAFLEDFLGEEPRGRAEWDATQKLKNDPRITVGGPGSAQDLARRAAAAFQRPDRRHEPRGPAPDHGQSEGTLPRGSAITTCVPA
jgi:hypothetical protein